MIKLLKPEDAAARLAVTPKAVRAWLLQGKLPGIRLGRLWRIAEDKLEEFIAGPGFVQDALDRPRQAATATRSTPRKAHGSGPRPKRTQKARTREARASTEARAVEKARRERKRRERGKRKGKGG